MGLRTRLKDIAGLLRRARPTDKVTITDPVIIDVPGQWEREVDSKRQFGKTIRGQKLGPMTVTLEFSATPDSEWSIGVFGDNQQYGWVPHANDVTDPLVDWLRELESARAVPRLAAECRRLGPGKKSIVVFLPSDDHLYRRAEIAERDAEDANATRTPLCQTLRRRGYRCDFTPTAQGGLHVIRDRAHGNLREPIILSIPTITSLRRRGYRWEVRGRTYRMRATTDIAKLGERIIATIEDAPVG